MPEDATAPIVGRPLRTGARRVREAVAGLLLALTVLAAPARAETITLFAADSLRDALTDVAAAYEASSGNKVAARFGPSGTLNSEFVAGAKADVIASADLQSLRALHDQGKAGPVVLFARDRLCALATPELKVTAKNLLSRMLDGEVKLAIATPAADPAGDAALAVFAKAEAVKKGAKAILEKKAKRLTGTADSVIAPAGKNVYGWHIAEHHADVFLVFCTDAVIAARENHGQQSIQLPDNLRVGVGYGLTVIRRARRAAERFANFIVSPEGEAILAAYGFVPGTGP